MDCKISLDGELKNNVISIGGSKSETNRLLLLQALYPEIKITNASQADDSIVMREALESTDDVIDIGHAGTAMRFLTAYFAIFKNRSVILTGSPRMLERPIGILVHALRSLGADISYVDKTGYPPLSITGMDLRDQVLIDAGISSQYISALMLIAPKLENGLQINLVGDVTSEPYIKMTLSLLKKIGVPCEIGENSISIAVTANVPEQEIAVESDWSSASYFYSIAALSKIGTTIRLSGFSDNSIQGDSELMTIYQKFGVQSVIERGILEITKQDAAETFIELDLSATPDLAQTIAVTTAGLGIACRLSGLHTLKIKETDRLAALASELKKLGAEVFNDNESITIEKGEVKTPDTAIETFGDHRMAMAFAPLAVLFPVTIQSKEVVTKSYPTFWSDLQTLGFTVKDIQRQ